MIERTNETSYNKEPILAVIGGGRWGRVIVSVLAGMNVPFNRIVVVSSANAQALARLIEAQPSSLPISIIPSLEELLLRYNVHTAIIANSAHQHFDTSVRLIDHGVNVLIEKPIVLSSEHAHLLLNKAIASSVCLVPGLQYRFCSYLYRFAEQISRFEKTPHRFFVKWSDQAGEKRYGETKTYDPNINVAQDVMPHIWTILATIFGQTHINVDSCQKVSHNGCYADFSVTVKDGLKGGITLKRDAIQRQRMVSVQFDSDENLSIDFTNEPGIISLNRKTISADPNWEKNPKPLERQLDYFLSTLNEGLTTNADIRTCLDSVAFSEQASALIDHMQKSPKEAEQV